MKVDGFCSLTGGFGQMVFNKNFLLFLTLSILSVTTLRTSFTQAAWVDDEYQSNYPAYNQPERYQTVRKSSQKEKRKDFTPFSPESNNLSLDIGQIFLMGDLASLDDALGIQTTYTYGVSRIFAFESSLGYSNHSNGKYSMLNLLGGMRLNLSNYDKVIPYLNGGLGFYRPSRQISNVGSTSATLFGVHVGGGADLIISQEMYFGASLNYHNLFSGNRTTATGPIDLGGSYINFMARVGYSF